MGGPAGRAADFGVYVHVPFCTKRCDYCAFATWTDRSHLTQRYVDAVCSEIRRSEAPVASSVFVGGGTPSLLSGQQMGAILDAIPRRSDAEVTIECNPDTVSAELFAAYVDHGVTRVSFGVQSMVDSVLAALGRTHVRANVERGVELVRAAGISTFNLDLIYGAAGETVADWATTLDAVVALDPPHVSAYALTIEAGTPLAADATRHPDDDDQADKYELATQVLGVAGLASYEISNWARPGHECRHNQLYWAQGDYLGYGCAAHSHQRHVDGTSRRWWNVRTPERYIALVDAGGSTTEAGEDLSVDAVQIEGLQLALRMSGGVPLGALGADDRAELVDAGLIAVAAGRVRLTTAGRMMANTVSIRLQVPPDS
jgi:putative oxygen-independent coproporphyrinogen III oxidase